MGKHSVRRHPLRSRWMMLVALGGASALTVQTHAAMAETDQAEDRGTAENSQGNNDTDQGQDNQGHTQGQDGQDQGSNGDQGGSEDGSAGGPGEGVDSFGDGGPTTGPALNESMKMPEPKVDLPEAVDVSNDSWTLQQVCDPVTRPGVVALGKMLGEHFDRPNFTTYRECPDHYSNHSDGRAMDWQLNAGNPEDKKIADAAVAWLTANDGEMARRIGIQSIIWNHQVWRANKGEWHTYHGASPHTDHVHFTMTWDGSYQRTSWWTGVAVRTPDQGPCPAGSKAEATTPGGATYQGPRYTACEGQAKTELMQEPTVLNAETGETAALPTRTSEQRPWYSTNLFQPYRDIAVERGDEGDEVELLQEVLGIDVDGSFGPATEKAVKDAQKRLGLKQTGTTSRALWLGLGEERQPVMPHGQKDIEVGAEGGKVKQLQKALDIKVDGDFGRQTKEAVEELQQREELEVTGVVDGPTWVAAMREQMSREFETKKDDKGSKSQQDGAASTTKDNERQGANAGNND